MMRFRINAVCKRVGVDEPPALRTFTMQWPKAPLMPDEVRATFQDRWQIEKITSIKKLED